MNQTHIDNKTITIKWNTADDDELFVDIYRYGGMLKSEKCKGTTVYTADEQGVYRFIAYKEKKGRRISFSQQIVELFHQDTREKYDRFKGEKVSDIRHPLDYYSYRKPFQDIAVCINIANLAVMQNAGFKNYFITKYNENISFISLEKPVPIENGFALLSGYMFCNGKLIFGNDDVKEADCLKTDFEGCYTRVAALGDKIRLDSDHFGTHAFYLFEQGDTVIICNHYHMLMRLLRILGNVHLSIRSDYISNIMAGFCGVNEYPFDDYTLFNEIRTVSIYERLEIADGVINKSKSEIYNDLNRKRPVWSSQLYQKKLQEAAMSIVNTVQIIAGDERIKKISAELTGGVDSRCVFAALSRLEDRHKFRYYNGAEQKDNEFTIPVMLADRMGIPFDFARGEHSSTEEFRQLMMKKMSLSMHKLIDAHVLFQEYNAGDGVLCLNGGDAGFRGSFLNDILFRGYDFIDDFGILKEDFKEEDIETLNDALSRFAICSGTSIGILRENFLNTLDGLAGCDFEKAERMYFNRARYHYSPIRDGGYGILQISPLLNRKIVRLFYGTFGEIDAYKVEFDVLFHLNPLLGIHEFKNQQYNQYVLKNYSEYTKTLIPDAKDLTKFTEQRTAYEAERKTVPGYASRINEIRNKNITSKSTDLKQWSIELIHYIINVVQNEKVTETLFYPWFFLCEKLPDVVPAVHNWAVYCMFIRLANIAYQLKEIEEEILLK